jgi:hypothetical protein
MAHSNLDDTRQDAIMQQLFGVVNIFLAAAGPTLARRLRVRTYKVRGRVSALHTSFAACSKAEKKCVFQRTTKSHGLSILSNHV